MRMECLVKRVCPVCLASDDWSLVDDSEKNRMIEVECPSCGARFIHKVKVSKGREVKK
jgi:DNA-directed RNA polymerase subunit RPC12/RpoP